MNKYDLVIIGCGIYGLYISNLKIFENKSILIIEMDDEPFARASFVNQARLHNGYHYPRSLSTANDTHKYFDRFQQEFNYAINSSFYNVYAIANKDSLTTKEKFEIFCKQASIPFEEIDSKKYFKKDMVSAAYKVKEYIFDTNKIKEKLLNDIKNKNITIKYSCYISSVETKNDEYNLTLNNGDLIVTPLVINTTYASVNLINKMFTAKLLKLKYELCEVELGIPSIELKDYSFTIMDGEFFSTMPFGNSEYHTLTSVHFTPHETSYDETPKFDCQCKHSNCGENIIFNCNKCPYKPESKNREMLDLFNKYLLDKYKFEYKKSLYAIKPILLDCEENDARPTIIERHSSNPTFISCLSGKVSTIYLMEEFIKKILEEE